MTCCVKFDTESKPILDVDIINVSGPEGPDAKMNDYNAINIACEERINLDVIKCKANTVCK